MSGRDARRLRLGLLVNPLAGVGGPVARKGSDNLSAQEYATLQPTARASARATEVLIGLRRADVSFSLLVWGGAMGADAATAAGCAFTIGGQPERQQTTSADSVTAATVLAPQVDLLLFAGGDGTARDVCQAVGSGPLVLGIPAGVKMHSGVFALSPGSAVGLLRALAAGELVASCAGEVRDIDEAELRAGRMRARTWGHLRVPAEHRFVQAVKSSGRENEALVHEDIAAELLERMADGGLWLLGAGSTLAAVKRQLHGRPTLLGVDAARAGELVATDLSTAGIEALLDEAGDTDGHDVHVVVSPTGGQGFLLGRGNQQLSASVLRRVGSANLLVAASRAKLLALQGRPLLVDTQDLALNREFDGWRDVITGYDDHVLYRVQGLT